MKCAMADAGCAGKINGAGKLGDERQDGFN
jgi:hypothetical protein